MRCPNCQKLILNNLKTCPYCGKDIATSNSNVHDMFETSPSPMSAMPSAAGIPPAEHHEAVQTEVKKRRWQRWVFYALVVLIVLGAVGLIVKMNNDNTKLLLAVSETQKELNSKRSELDAKTTEATVASENLKKVQAQLDQQASQYKTEIEGQATAVKDLEQCRIELTASDANIYNLILELGSGITTVDLTRIPVADANLGSGVDTDKDGLSDEAETAVGTDPSKEDTDGDTFKDKEELLGGFNPAKAGERLPIDNGYANQQKGKIVIAVDGQKDAWYISPDDGKRYFLGQPGDAYKAMRSIEYWTKNFKK